MIYKKKIRPTKKEKVLKTTLIILTLIIAAIGILLFGILNGGNVKDSSTIINDLYYALFTTIISIVVVTIAYTIYTEIDFKNKIEETILDSLSANHIVISKYQQSEIVEIIKNCLIMILGKDLSGSFFRHVLSKQISSISYRSQFNYSVNYSPGDIPDTYKISQSLEYIKHIRKKCTGNLKVSCFFYYKEDPFKRKPPTENLVFFREELASKVFFDSLVSLKGKDQEILNQLGFAVEICNKMNKLETIEKAKIKAEVVEKEMKKAIVITFEIPKTSIKKDEDDFISFYAKICCSYPSNNDKYFYCVFPEPTIDAQFSISFHESIVSKHNVHHVSFVGNENYKPIPDDHQNEIIFRMQGNLDENSKKNNAIFPHAGIVFNW